MVRGRPQRGRRSLAMLGIVAVAGLLASVLVAASALARTRSIRITPAGRIGALRLNISTAADIQRHWGTPGFTTIANVNGTRSHHAGSGYPNYLLLGYHCHRRLGRMVCAINFYVSERTGRLESFLTSSPRFSFRGVRPGMPADLASRRLHRPDISGCGQFIAAPTRRLSVEFFTRGGREHFRNHALHVSGGRVLQIAIDDKRHGVGVLFC